MIRTQIYLTEKEREGLGALARATGKKQAELVREAVDRLIESASAKRRDAILVRAAGIWRHRDDLGDPRDLRESWDRR